MPSVATGRTGSRRADPERPQSSQHRQGVAFIIGVFKSADDGCSRADELGKLSLGYARRCAQLVDFAGDLFICPSLVQLPQPTWPAFRNSGGAERPNYHWMVSNALPYQPSSYCVPRRIRLKPFLAVDCMLDFPGRHRPLLHDPVRDNDCERSMEEIQDPMVHAPKAGTQLV